MRDDSTDNWTDESDTSAESGTNSTFSRVSQDGQGPSSHKHEVVDSAVRKPSTFQSYQSFADIEPTLIQPGDSDKEDDSHVIDSSRYSASAASNALAGILSKSQSTTKTSRISSWLFSV